LYSVQPPHCTCPSFYHSVIRAFIIRLIVRNRVSCFNIIMYDNDNVYNIMILRRGALLMRRDNNTISDILAYCYEVSRRECILRFWKRRGTREYLILVCIWRRRRPFFTEKDIFSAVMVLSKWDKLFSTRAMVVWVRTHLLAFMDSWSKTTLFYLVFISSALHSYRVRISPEFK